MREEFGPDFITVTDEEGNDIELELLDVLEYNGQTYIQENGEELLSTLDSEAELTEIYNQFMEIFFEDEDK